MPALLLALLLAAPAAAACQVDHASLLSAPYEQFDETLGSGWRVIGDRPGCELAAADVIAEYRNKNAVSLVEGPPEAIRSLDWHEGQLRAAAGQTALAIALLKRGSRQSDSAGDSLYHAATIAFLERDKAKLLAIRDKIAALPEPDGFQRAAEEARAKGVRVATWPVHIGEVTGFINCFDEPYGRAYTYACREHPQADIRP